MNRRKFLELSAAGSALPTRSEAWWNGWARRGPPA
jgi:hypothetical protein